MKEMSKNICMFIYASEDLSMDNIEEFSDSPFAEGGSATSDSPFDESNKEKTADVENVESEDDTETQEEVGDDDNNEDEVEPESSKKTDEGSSPKLTHSSAYLKALKDDGVLPDLDDEFIKEATTPEKFAEAIEMQVEARLDEKQKRINEALKVDVQVDDIRRYENAISYLDSIDEDSISGEDDQSETLRRQLIYQDYINKGFKPERAKKEVDKSFNAGTDIEDAKLSLDSNKEFFEDEYRNLVETNKAKAKQEKLDREKQVSEFKKKVLENEAPLGVKVDKAVRQKVLDNIIKPVHKDSNGKLLTSIQKYSKENPNDSEYYFSLFYELTDGFKNVDKLVGVKVKEKTKSALRELDKKLKNTSLNSDGTVDFNYGLDGEASFNSLPKGFKFV